MAQEEYFFDSLETSFEDTDKYEDASENRNEIDNNKKPSKIPVYKALRCMKKIKKININGRTLSEALNEYKVSINNDSDNNSEVTRPPSRRINKKLVDEAKNDLIQRENLRKTYLGIFQVKTGFGNYKNVDELDLVSSKSTYGGSTMRSVTSKQSGRSIKSEYSGPAWETASMYTNYIMDKKFNTNSQGRSTVKTENLYIETCNESVNNSSLNNFYSVSEACIPSQSSKLTNTPKRKLEKFNIDNYRTRPVSRIGSEILPTDIKEKAVRLKRMQEYGQRASIRNRARVIVKQQSFVT